MNKKYYFKLMSGEKFEVPKSTFDLWLHNSAGDYIVIDTPNNNHVFIKKDMISLGFDLDLETFDNTKGKK